MDTPSIPDLSLERPESFRKFIVPLRSPAAVAFEPVVQAEVGTWFRLEGHQRQLDASRSLEVFLSPRLKNEKGGIIVIEIRLVGDSNYDLIPPGTWTELRSAVMQNVTTRLAQLAPPDWAKAGQPFAWSIDPIPDRPMDPEQVRKTRQKMAAKKKKVSL